MKVMGQTDTVVSKWLFLVIRSRSEGQGPLADAQMPTTNRATLIIDKFC